MSAHEDPAVTAWREVTGPPVRILVTEQWLIDHAPDRVLIEYDKTTVRATWGGTTYVANLPAADDGPDVEPLPPEWDWSPGDLDAEADRQAGWHFPNEAGWL